MHIIITSDVHQQLAAELRRVLVSLGEAQVKGKKQPVTLYGVREDPVYP